MPDGSNSPLLLITNDFGPRAGGSGLRGSRCRPIFCRARHAGSATTPARAAQNPTPGASAHARYPRSLAWPIVQTPLHDESEKTA